MNYLFFLSFLFLTSSYSDWGFFCHREINALAIYTLPPEMKVFFSPNQDYFSRHAIDADKRRYASSFEAPRHYMDLDHYGKPPFTELSRDFRTDLRQNCKFFWVVDSEKSNFQLNDSLLLSESFKIWFDTLAMNYYYDEEWIVPLDASFGRDSSRYRISVSDEFTEHGVLPYNIVRVYRQLKEAFRSLNAQKICRYAADLGHYIGDATVPLHTSSNYNGQNSGQYGIHAFWESRLPEYFSNDYLSWVGAANYINDVDSCIWQIVTESHVLVDDVLRKEKEVRALLDDELEFGIIERGGRLINTQSDTLTELYHEALRGMVEQRFRRAIHTLGSYWYSAWVDAGMPDLSILRADFSSSQPIEKGRFIRRRKHFE